MPQRFVSGSSETAGTLAPSVAAVTEHRTPGTPVLPDAVLAKVASRLGIISLMYAVSFAVVHAAVRLANLPDYWREGPAGMRLNDATALLFIALSVGMFALARSDRLARETLIRIGLAYEIVAAFGIEIATVFFPSPDLLIPNGISWSCVLIVIFPLIVPTTTRYTLLAALAAAAMRPLAFSLLALDGVALPTAASLFLLLLPNFLSVGVAVIAARVVNEFGADLSRARRMGSYQLVERLGEGGMGEVWRATHRLLARPAAIKLIRPERLGSGPTPRSTLMKRFEREARATAALSSPHTIQLHDFGTTAEGVFYYVMELLHGLDLGELVRRFGPQPPNRVVYIMRQVCRSLAEAHATGLVHRDVKPENIYLCRIGLEYDFVKVLDFGLVKSVEQTGTALTLKNVATGTPAFMAPEIALGESHVDGRADLYAVGCVAYWLLSGELVFTTPNPMRAIFAHINTTPERVSGRTEVPVPPELEDLIMACLEKQPDSRPPTAVDLLRCLNAIDLGTPWTGDRAVDWWRAHLPELVDD